MTRNMTLFALCVAAAAALIACNDDSAPSHPIAAAIEPAASASRASRCKPAVPDSEIDIPIAPRSQRVDLDPPVFSNPTNVTNPLFPISALSQAILVGSVDGSPLRIETTLLPGTNRIDIGDRVVETLTSQFVAYADGRIHEVALDWYAQADDGAVWYLGEDVFNYEDGELADIEGTWIACQDGPPAMIMPAHPRVGDVYRPENAFPVVFEEVTVKSVGQTVDGPRGPVRGAITVEELHMEGDLEDKIFAPGYGEFFSGAGGDVEALALAVPIDALPGRAPAELRTLLAGARRVFRAAGSGDWVGASRTVRAMNVAWARHRAGGVPRLLEPLMTEALDDLTEAVVGRKPAKSRQAALNVTLNGLDLLLQYRSRIEVDFARLDLWARQVVIDAEDRDAAGVASDVAILERILDRLDQTGEAGDVHRARQLVHRIGAAADHSDFSAVRDGARRLLELLSERVEKDDEDDETDENDN